jgi:hypothetical protein
LLCFPLKLYPGGIRTQIFRSSGGFGDHNRTCVFLFRREKKRKTYDSILKFGAWEAAILVATGFIGGIFTAIAGSGVDICSFSILSLLFRLVSASEQN